MKMAVSVLTVAVLPALLGPALGQPLEDVETAWVRWGSQLPKPARSR